MFPQLKSLDFAKVTEDEKDSAKLQIIVNKNNKGKNSKEGGKRSLQHNNIQHARDAELKKYSL